jgi:hypothetical protein
MNRSLRWLLLPLLFPLAASLSLSAADPVRLTTQHVDLRITAQPGDPVVLGLVASDRDAGVAYATTNVVIEVPEAARIELPEGFDVFGPPGAPLWILPQSQEPNLLYLGFSAEGLPPGLLVNPLEIRVIRVSGPGHFFAWQADAFGSIALQVNSRDGLSASDAFRPSIGGHEHRNVGFTTNGLYELGLQVSARPAGSETNVVSEEIVLRFEVLPLPPPPASPFVAWQERYWPGERRAEIIGPEADPDGDGEPNLLEFVFGSNPREADAATRVRVSVRPGESSDRARVEFFFVVAHQVPDTVDVRLEATSSLAPTAWEPVPLSAPEYIAVPQGLAPFGRWAAEEPVNQRSTRIYRLNARLR